MATLTAKRGLPKNITAVTSVVNVNRYLGTDTGEIWSQVISSTVLAKTGQLREGISAMTTDETYNYIGTNKGNIYRQTIAGGAIDAAPIAKIPPGGGAIISMDYDATLADVHLVTNDGKIYQLAI